MGYEATTNYFYDTYEIYMLHHACLHKIEWNVMGITIQEGHNFY
jgi:hypothetical protein